MQWWRDAINSEDNFLLEEDDIFRSWQFGNRTFTSDSPQRTIQGLFPFWRSPGVSISVEPGQWSPVADGVRNRRTIWLAYGDLVDFLLSGEIVVRENATLGWGRR
jgi:hypothetical protein